MNQCLWLIRKSIKNKVDGNYDSIVCVSRQTCNSLNFICFDNNIVAAATFFHKIACEIKHWWDCCGCNILRTGIQWLNAHLNSIMKNADARTQRVAKKRDALSITGAYCTIHIDQSLMNCGYRLQSVRTFWSTICSFAVLFIYLSHKWKWKSNRQRCDERETKKSERDFTKSNNKYKSSVWVKSTALVFFPFRRFFLFQPC